MVVINTVIAMAGLFGIAAGLNGHLMGKINPVVRVLGVVGGICMMIPLAGFADMSIIAVNVVGIVLVAAVVVFQKFFGKKNEADMAAA